MTQDQALSILKTGVSVFLTGEPGSGKTHTINFYIEYLRKNGINVAVTASTGIAATHLNGVTIHSWSGIGIKKELSERDLFTLCNNDRLVNKVRKTSVLIIDEISMVDARLLSCVEQSIKALRENNKPFGGLQVVFVGDFFQLPPVPTENKDVQFAFESPSWSNLNPTVCYLSEQYRQDDEHFTSILKSIRNRNGITQIYQTLSERKVTVDIEKTITRLYSHNIDVNTINDKKLAALVEEEHVFNMTSKGRKTLIERIKKSCLSPETLILKKGARVIFTKNNFEKGFVNGTLGKVVDFSENDIPIILTKQNRKIEASPMEWSIEEQDKVLASITQIPLRLAWAITVHKSQGMTLDAAIVDLSDAFEYGQGYVAMSRVKSLSGLFLLGLNRRALEVHPEVAKADMIFREKSQKVVPILSTYSETELLEKHKNFILRNDGSLEKVKSAPTRSTYNETLSLYKEGKNISEIAKERGITKGTIIKHLEKLKFEGKIISKELERIVPKELVQKLPEIHQALTNFEGGKLSPVFNKFNGRYSYDELRLARLVIANSKQNDYVN